MGFTQDFFTSRRNYSDGSTRVGQEGRIWYDSETGSFRVGDGVNVGGAAIGPSQIYTAGIGLSVNQHTGNVIISSNATPLAIPNTIVSRDGSNNTFFQSLTSNILLVTGNLTVLGNSRFVDQQLISIQNKNLLLANTSPSPSDFAANGGGIILLGTTNHTILWDEVTSTWESSENFSLIAGRYYAINHVPVLTVNSVLDTATSANLALVANIVRIGGIGGNTTIRGNLQVDGNLTVNGSFPINRDYDYLNFDTTLANPAHLEGRLFYDNNEKSLAYYSEATDLTLNIGQETVFRARNQSGVPLFSGNVVYISGATGNLPTIARAQANNITTAQVVGVVTTSIPNNGFGYVTLNGVIHDVNTSGMTAGALLYLSPSIAGEFTTTKPSHPNYEVQIGYVTRVNPSAGHFVIHLRNNLFSQLMVNGEANFESNAVIDKNLTVANSASVNNWLIAGNLLTNSEAKVLGVTNLVGNVYTGPAHLTSLLVTTNANVVGTLTVNGATTLKGPATGGNLVLTNIVVTGTSLFTGPVTAHDIDAATLDTTGPVTIANTLAITGNLSVNTNRFVINASSGDTSILGNLRIAGANIDLPTSANIGSLSSALNIGHIIGTTRVRNNLEVNGDLMIDGGYLNASTVAFNMLNTTTTIVNAFNAATTIVLAAPTGITTIRNNVIINGNLDLDKNLNIDGDELTVTSSTFKLANSVVSSVDTFGSATLVNMGAAGLNGIMNIRNDRVIMGGNLNVNSGRIDSTKNIIDLLPTPSTRINFGATANIINIGDTLGFGTTNILHNMYIQGNLFVNGNNVTFNSAVSVVSDPVLILGGAPPSLVDDNKDRGLQFSWNTGSAPRTGFFGFDDSAQEFTFIPEANNLGEVFTGTPGAVRFGPIVGNSGLFSANVTMQAELFVDSGKINSSATTVRIIDNTATVIHMGNAASSITLGSLTSTVFTQSNLQVKGTSLSTNQTSFELLNSTVTTGNLYGAATLVTIGASTGTAVIRNAVTRLDGDLEIRGGDITTNQTAFNLLNTTATTLNIGGAATTITLGATGGATVNNGTFEVRGASLTTNQATFALLNTTATTLNFAGAASTINMGFSGGSLTIKNDTVILDGDLRVNGGDIVTNLGSFNLINTNAISINAFNAATTIVMGAATGTTNIRNNLDLDKDLNIDGIAITTSSTNFSLLNSVATTVSAFNAATNLLLGATTGSTTIRNRLNLNNDLDILGSVQIDVNLVVDGTVNIDGLTDIDNSLDVRDNLIVGGTGQFNGTLTLASTLASNQATFNLINTLTSTVNAFGAASLIEIGSASGTTNINNNLVVDLDLEVKGGDITTNQTTFNLVNTTATTVNFAGAATSLNLGSATGTLTLNNATVVGNASNTTVNLWNTLATTVNAFGAATSLTLGALTGTTTIRNNLSITGDLTVNGTLTTLNSVTLTVDDKNIELGSVATPTDATADGGGITLRGTTQKTIIWDQANINWTSSEHWNIVTGKSFKINNVSVLNATTLGATVVNSSLEQLGTINAGTWQGTVITGQYGGTGVNNVGKTITLGGNFSTAGSFNLSLVLSGATTITLPTTGTIATLAGAETLTNKSISFTNNTLTGTKAEFDTACTDGNFGFHSDKLNVFAATTSAELATVLSDETGTGVVVFSDSPTLVTPTLGAATATSINGLTISSTTGTLTIATGKTVQVDNTLTFQGTDGSTISFGAGGTVTYTTDKLDVFAATTSAELAGVITDETGTGELVFSDDATLTNVTITDVMTITPSSAAPGSPAAGMIAVADGTSWDPAGLLGSVPYPVFFDGGLWYKMIP